MESIAFEPDLLKTITFLQGRIVSQQATLFEYLMAVTLLTEHKFVTSEDLSVQVALRGELGAVNHFLNIAILKTKLNNNQN
ncbi:hypothetical protein VB776_06740 [Arcicella sp. DC2W]|uniref:Uncharacterized protein n=1 Tax=Arcicella gelida TaxID=2984195 RepID=A0ABU5S2U5_9BACT|nr:hypothetical protein [Arcicella sp. DC2W]MEA5402603.1 hypothetical protein [Arcicella sp. DC2W]